VFEERSWENLAHANRNFWSFVNRLSRLALIVLLFVVVLVSSALSTLVFVFIVFNMDAATSNFTLTNAEGDAGGAGNETSDNSSTLNTNVLVSSS
jgi:hypothetical protein